MATGKTAAPADATRRVLSIGALSQDPRRMFAWYIPREPVAGIGNWTGIGGRIRIGEGYMLL